MKKKKRLPKDILDSEEENELVGGMGQPPAKKVKTEYVPDENLIRNDSVIAVPSGFPDSPFAFTDSCLLVALAIGTLYHEAQAEKDPKKRKKWKEVSQT